MIRFVAVNVYAMSPVLPDDSVLLTLPFGGAVLQKIGVSKPEIDAILEDFRKMYIDDKELDEGSFDFLTSFRRRLPPSIAETRTEFVGAPASEVIVKSSGNVTESLMIQHAESGFGLGYYSQDNNSSSDNNPESPDFYLPPNPSESGLMQDGIVSVMGLSDNLGLEESEKPMAFIDQVIEYRHESLDESNLSQDPSFNVI